MSEPSPAANWEEVFDEPDEPAGQARWQKAGFAPLGKCILTVKTFPYKGMLLQVRQPNCEAPTNVSADELSRLPKCTSYRLCAKCSSNPENKIGCWDKEGKWCGTCINRGRFGCCEKDDDEHIPCIHPDQDPTVERPANAPVAPVFYTVYGACGMGLLCPIPNCSRFHCIPPELVDIFYLDKAVSILSASKQLKGFAQGANISPVLQATFPVLSQVISEAETAAEYNKGGKKHRVPAAVHRPLAGTPIQQAMQAAMDNMQQIYCWHCENNCCDPRRCPKRQKQVETQPQPQRTPGCDPCKKGYCDGRCKKQLLPSNGCWYFEQGRCDGRCGKH